MTNDTLTIKARLGGKQLPPLNLEWSKVLGSGASLFLNIDQMRKSLAYDFTNRSWDFMRIAAAVYAADRSVKRPPKRGNDAWIRQIKLEFPVEDPVFWNSPETIGFITEALHFLTDDNWTFKFTASPNKERQGALQFDSRLPAKYFLYSGGLDSAAGLVKYANKYRSDLIFPVLVGHRSNMPGKVQAQVDCIRNKFPNIQQAIVVPFNMSHSPHEETSQRSRNFLFLTIAGVAAGKRVGDSVLVGENGIGAINLPLSTLMVGTMATRGAHPAFLKKMSGLSSHVFGRRLDYSLPHLHSTKGELVRALKEHGLEGIATSTFSCSHPLREKIANQCGQCPACIFRRHSLWIAGIVDPAERSEPSTG